MTPEQLAEGLIGSCRVPTDEEQGLLDQFGFADEFDQYAFLCSDCGWWCSTDEANDIDSGADIICDQCYGDHE